MNSHYRPLYNQLFGDYIPFDYLGKFESFSEDFAFIVEQLNIDEIHSYRQHQTGANELVDKYVGHNEAELINSIYRKDFVKFGYEMDG